MTSRGRWRFRSDMAPYFGSTVTGVWQLEDYDWWLYRRTGAKYSHRWCGYCWTPPYRWWMLFRGDPAEGVLLVPPRWWREVTKKYYAVCTHQHTLTGAMRVSERAHGEHILKTLANL